MSAGGFLRRTLRGFRIVEVIGLTVMLGLALAVYLVKARAGRETGDIAAVESQIADEQRRVRLLDAEVAHLEEPARLERLSESLGLQPTSDTRETVLDRLPELARQTASTPDTPKAATPAAPPAQAGVPR